MVLDGRNYEPLALRTQAICMGIREVRRVCVHYGSEFVLCIISYVLSKRITAMQIKPAKLQITK